MFDSLGPILGGKKTQLSTCFMYDPNKKSESGDRLVDFSLKMK